MVGFNHIVTEHPIDERGLRLAFADTRFHAVTPFGVVAAMYQRPVRVVGPGVDLPIRDHVMITRLLVLIVVLVFNLVSRVHGR